MSNWSEKNVIRLSTFFEKLLVTGVVASPNYPKDYPNYLDKNHTIQVEKGQILSLQFTAFDVMTCRGNLTCDCDYLKIIDGDGTTLMEKSCGRSGNPWMDVFGGQEIGSSLPPNFRSRSNSINITFSTDGSDTKTGWSFSWSAETPPGKGGVFFQSVTGYTYLLSFVSYSVFP